jgi:hypothetical protein
VRRPNHYRSHGFGAAKGFATRAICQPNRLARPAAYINTRCATAGVRA